MSQTHKFTIYMKYFKLLLLFLFISVQNATATYVEYKYSDEEISKNEKGISLILRFTDLDDNMKAIESGGIRVRFWNDPACTQPMKTRATNTRRCITSRHRTPLTCPPYLSKRTCSQGMATTISVRCKYTSP